jgi:hypothetical protein
LRKFLPLPSSGRPPRLHQECVDRLAERGRKAAGEEVAEFNRAAFWLDMASRQWTVSTSASFAALVSTVEAPINGRGHGSAKRFREFL